MLCKGNFLYVQGIGNSAQGLANFILFCCFTKLVREKLFGFFCGCSACKSLVLWNQQRRARGMDRTGEGRWSNRVSLNGPRSNYDYVVSDSYTTTAVSDYR